MKARLFLHIALLVLMLGFISLNVVPNLYGTAAVSATVDVDSVPALASWDGPVED